MVSINIKRISNLSTDFSDENYVEDLEKYFTPRTSMASCLVNESIFLFGGSTGYQSDAHFMEFSPSSQCFKFHQFPIQPPPRTAATMVSIPPWLFLYGGFNMAFKPTDQYVSFSMNKNFMDSINQIKLDPEIYGYHTDLKIWRTLPVQNNLIPLPRYSHTCCVWKKSFVIFGGTSGQNIFGDCFLGDVKNLNVPNNYSDSDEAIVKKHGKDHTFVDDTSCDSPVLDNSYLDSSSFSSESVQATTDSVLIQWKKVAVNEKMAPRMGHSAVIHNDKLIFFGGWNGTHCLDLFESLDLESSTMKSIQFNGTAPKARYKHSCIKINDTLFISGGVDDACTLFKDLHHFCINDYIWTQVSQVGSIPFSRVGAEWVLLNNFIFVFGGYNQRRCGWRESLQLHLYDGEQNEKNHTKPEECLKWDLITPLNIGYSPRTGHWAVKHKNNIYLHAGMDNDSIQNDLFMYDIKTNIWKELQCTDPPLPCSGAKALVLKDYIYSFGGYMSRDSDHYNNINQFHIPTHTWKQLSNFSGAAPEPRVGHAMACTKQSLWIIAGTTSSKIWNDIYQFDTEKKEWSKHTVKSAMRPKLERFGHTAVVYKQDILIFGGWNGQHNFNDILKFDTNQLTLKKVLVMSGTPPSRRYRHVAVCVSDSMYIFGGVTDKGIRSDELHQYQILTKSWTQVNFQGQVPTGRSFHQVVVASGKMFILGGFDGDRLNDLWRLKLKRSGRETHSETVSSKRGCNDSDDVTSNILESEKTKKNKFLSSHDSAASLKSTSRKLKDKKNKSKAAYDSNFSTDKALKKKSKRNNSERLSITEENIKTSRAHSLADIEK